MRVFVYYNLHKKLWSVKALEGADKGRVIAHRDVLVLRNAKPKVSEAGRQRVLREKRKNVHAGIEGDYRENAVAIGWLNGDDITYNPYKYKTFVYTDDESEYTGSDVAWFSDRNVRVR